MAILKRNIRNKFYRPNCPACFTLIELLVVISIISLLISILLPALSNARKNAQAIACLSTQRQLYMGQRMYADTYNGYFAQAKMTTSSNSLDGLRRTYWQFLTSEFIDGSHGKLNFGELSETYHCPTWSRAWYDLDHSRLGIGMNACPDRPNDYSSIFSTSWKNSDGTIKAFRFDDISHQSEKMMLGDSSVYYILPKSSSPYFVWQLNTITAIKPWIYLTSAPERHLENANYIMFDGHGKRMNPDDAMYAIVLK